jgi:hypothetical protein
MGGQRREGDPWSRGGQATREEVRAIFARHAEARSVSEATPEPGQRHSAVPGLASLPAHGWRLLSRQGQALVLTLGAVLLTLALALLPPALDNGSRNRAAEQAESAATRQRIKRDLVESQAPRRARLTAGTPLAPALAKRIRADARRRARAGRLAGPIGHTSCDRIRRTGEDSRFATFTCLVESGGRGTYQGRDMLVGYRFRGRVELRSGMAAWCKEHPQPLHADQEEFVKVAISRACTG